MNNTTEHTKYFNSNGIEVPSCTNIVKLLGKDELVGWANYLGFKRIDVKKLLAEKALYGTNCHDVAEQYLTGMIQRCVPSDLNLSQYEYTDLIHKLEYISQKFSEMGIRIINTEMQMHGERFGGTLDLLTWKPSSDKVILFDYKTSKAVYDSHLIQLGGYCKLLEELYDISVTDIGVILLSKQPSDKNFFNVIPRESNSKNEEIFDKLLDIYWIKHG